MSVDEVMLMAYVDRTSTLRERREVEAVIAGSTDACACVARLEASRLPYREAFARQKLPPVPAALAQRIRQMAMLVKPTDAATGVRSGRHAPGASHAVPPVYTHEIRATIRSRPRVAPGWLAVAFVAGAFCLDATWRLASVGIGPVWPVWSATSASPWVQAAAGYLQLYSSQTVLDARADPGAVARTIDAIRREDRLALRVPDLRDAGMTLRSAQRLRFHDSPLVQLVYVPEDGEPVALCAMKQDGPDQAFDAQAVSGMSVATWRQNEVAYALIAAPGDVDLASLGRRIAERRVDLLFGH
jgi:anti-sigma factor RsiW